MIPAFEEAGGGTDVARGMWDGVGWKSSAEGRERDAKPPKTGAERSGGLFLFGMGLVSYGEKGGRKGSGWGVEYAMKFVSPSIWVMRIPICDVCVSVYAVMHMYGEELFFSGGVK